MKIIKFLPVSREKYETLERKSNFYKCQRDALKEEVADLISKKNKNEYLLSVAIKNITLLDFSGFNEHPKTED